MRKETIVRDLYQFSELSEAAKEKARDWYREGMYLYNYDFECVIEDAKIIGALIGINIAKVFYSGFCSQGDGACFEGSYSYKKGSVKLIKDYAPLDVKLHAIAETLQAIQKRNFYKLTAKVKQSGFYMHSNCTDIEVMKDNDWPTNDDDKEIKEALKDFMNWIYRQLDMQNDYINSNESIDDNIEANEYEFLENGKRA